MLCLSARTYEKEKCSRDFNLLHSYVRTLTFSGEATKESVYFSRNEDNTVVFHIYFHHRTDEKHWVDYSLGDDEVRFYDCDLETFKNYIGLLCFYGEIGESDWRKLDEFVWKELKCGLEY